MFYKPFSVMNPSSKDLGNEDEMAIDYPFKDQPKDSSFMKLSYDQSIQKRSSDDNMEVDSEPSILLSPRSRLWEFQAMV